MGKIILFSIAFFLCLPALSYGQNAVDTKAFRQMDSEERCEYIRQLNLSNLGQDGFLQHYRALLEIAEAEDDDRTVFLLELEKYQARFLFKWSKAEVLEHAVGLQELSQEIGWEVGNLVADHYLQFERYDQDLISKEQLYSHLLTEFEQIQAQGTAAFKLFDLARILHHSARFLHGLEDFEKALKILEVAEQCAVANDRGLQVWIFIHNRIASIYQQQGAYDKGIEYAKKLLAQMENCPSQWEEQKRLCKVWQGISLVDIADMLVKQGKPADGELYANRGYQIIKASADLQAEFDALLVLAPTKLELGKVDEAFLLLRRIDEILAPVSNQDYYYFKQIRFFEAYAKYWEKKGNLNEAYRYANLAKPLQDSLDRRNDARKYEKIQQRHEAEKYTQQLKLVESEKQMQKVLRNAAIIIMLLVGGLAYGNYRRLQYKRKQAVKELEAARHELADFTQRLLEKSELAENLRAELDRLAKSGERSDYLEKLTRSTILTDEDWAQFRSIFEKVYPNFIAEMKEKHPDLTQAELRYLVLEKLQLSTHEMANMLGVSDGTIRQTRMRMKRKVS